jgi:hypothetical protein
MRAILASVVIIAALHSVAKADQQADVVATPTGQGRSEIARVGADGRLMYAPHNASGDRIPDFSGCGYGGGGAMIPDLPAKETLSPTTGSADDTARIQAAIDKVSRLPPDAQGLRGAVLLKRGAYRCAEPLKITVGGVGLRGEGEQTILAATGKKPYTLISIAGSGRAQPVNGAKPTAITDTCVPVGARSFTVASAAGLVVGQPIFVTREGNAAWIREIGMDRITPRHADNPSGTRQWEPFSMNFERVITAIDGNRITIDVPILLSVDKRWGGGSIVRCEDIRRIEKCGVESLKAVSEFDRRKTGEANGEKVFVDEEHATYLVGFDNVKNAWARNLTAVNFQQGVMSIGAGAKWVTVQDCAALDPVSVITGGRRYPFSINGQQNLVLRCRADRARHAFVFGSRVPGPNVFLDCVSERDHATSEPHHRWSVGGLYDNVRGLIAFQDRQWMGSGHGWAGANYVAWNCEGSLVCQQPPTAQNFAIGFVGKKGKGAFERPDGWWESLNKHVEPRSLYIKQLEDRLGPEAARNLEPR